MLISRSVVRRKKNGRDLKSILRINFEPLARALNDTFASIRREGQPVTDYAAVLTDLGNAIDVDYEVLELADWANLAELANDRKLRRERDEATAVVHRTLTNITGIIDGAYGEGAAEEHLALGTGLRKEPELMLEAASHAAVRLADPELSFGELQPGGAPVDPADLLRQISGPLARLEDLLARLTDEEKKSLATLESKEQAIDRYDGTYSRDANILKAFLQFAGMDKQADRIRPKVRKRKAAEDDPVIETDDDGEELGVVDPESLPELVTAQAPPAPAAPAPVG